MDRRRLLTGLLLAAASAVLFSAKAIVVKLAYREGVDALTVVALRMGMALPVFAALSMRYVRRDGPLARRDTFRIVALGAGAYYASIVLDFAGLSYISAGLERLLLFLHPTFVLLLSALVLGRRVTGRELLAMALSYAGIALVMATSHRIEGAHVLLGSVLVLASAFVYAVYLVGAGELVRRLPSVRVSALSLTAACAAALVHFVSVRPLSDLAVSPTVWGLSAANALLCTVAPVLLLGEAIARVGAPRAAQVGMIGPVVTIGLGAWLLGEPVTAGQVAGGAMVLAGVGLIARRRVDASGVVTQDASGRG